VSKSVLEKLRPLTLGLKSSGTPEPTITQEITENQNIFNRILGNIETKRNPRASAFATFFT